MKKRILSLLVMLVAVGALTVFGLTVAPLENAAKSQETQAVSCDYYEDFFDYFYDEDYRAEQKSGYRIKNYDIEMKISSNRTIAVREVISCAFTTNYSDTHGIIRDLPLDSGVRYKNIKAECNNADFAPYSQSDDSAFLSLYLRGSGIVSGKERTYTLTYTMTVPALSDKGEIPLDVLGYGWDAPIDSFSAKVTVPNGFMDYRLYSGYHGASGNNADVTLKKNGNTFTLTAESLWSGQGVTLDLNFEKGALSTAFDWTILIAVALGLAAVGIAFAIKFFLCKQPLMTVTVNLTAPEEMDPLLMGKLIDNQVDSEDLGALIFYLADQGYLTIDLSQGEKDPTLISTGKSAQGLPEHIRVFYEGLFSGRESVRVKDLTNRFYLTAQATTANVEIRAGKMYESRSKVLIFIMGIVSVLLLGGFALLYNMLNSFGYSYWGAGLACLISFVIAMVGSYIAAQREFKWKKSTCIVSTVITFLLSLLSIIIFVVFRSPAFGVGTGVTLALFAAVSGSISGRFLIRTQEYSDRLGHIVGFKQFIMFTEKDKIDFMLKENPELYYHILPYAQVLGVTDAWTDKFKGLNMAPPAYMHHRNTFDVFDVLIWNHMFRHMTMNMAHTFVSKPSSSGGGVHHGGFGGGFGGGGFGGGGGRRC